MTAAAGPSSKSGSELADTLGQTGIHILAGAPVTATEKRFADPKVLAIKLMSRTLSNFRGVFTLIACNAMLGACVAVNEILGGHPQARSSDRLQTAIKR